MLYGSGEYSFELVDGWARLREGESFLDVCGIAIDRQDHVYVLSRSQNPIIVFSHNGDLISS